jgi:hypothetical protein
MTTSSGRELTDVVGYLFWAAPESTQLLMSADFPALSPDIWKYIEPPLPVAITSRELALPGLTARMTPT